MRRQLAIPHDATVVGFFAKGSSNELDRKGTDIFADAIQRLSRDLPSLAVLIVGPGWHDFVATLEASGVKCVWLPFVRDSVGMARMYHVLDFYWVTARVEGGPVTLLEAMSCGVCCITTPVGLAREIVVDEVNGAVVPFDDAPAVVRRTLVLLRDPRARSVMGTEARHTILTTMDVRVTTRRVRDVYGCALAHRDDRLRASGNRDHAPARRGESALPLKLANKLAMLERLAWAEALLLQDQGAVALRIICETWLQNPGSTLPPRHLFRNLLPKSFVKAFVRMKATVSSVTTHP